MSDLAKTGDTLRNMAEMMWRLGLTRLPATRSGDFDLHAAVTVCMACPAGQTCSDWLYRAPKTLDRAPVFCPNVEIFAKAATTER